MLGEAEGKRVIREGLYTVMWQKGNLGWDDDPGRFASTPSNNHYQVLASSVQEALATVPADAGYVKCRLDIPARAIVVAKEATVERA
jgi:hypothetical protein